MDFRLLWPDEARTKISQTKGSDNRSKAVLLARQYQYKESESHSLAYCSLQRKAMPCESAQSLEPLCALHLCCDRLEQAASALQKAEALSPGISSSDDKWRFRRLQLALKSGHNIPPEQDYGENQEISSLFFLLNLQALLLNRRIDEAYFLLENRQELKDFPESLEIRARIYIASNQHERAAALLERLLDRAPGSAGAWGAVVDINNAAGRDAGFALRRGLSLHPTNKPLLRALTPYLLHRRQSSSARRTSFRERCLSLTERHSAITPQSDANLIGCYDHTGRSDLCVAIHPRLQARLHLNPTLFANHAMQLASQLAPTYSAVAKKLASIYSGDTNVPPNKSKRSKKLRLGLISPDLHYHPVGRFTLMLLAAGFAEHGEVHLIRTNAAGVDNTASALDAIATEQGHLHNISDLDEAKQLLAVRELQLDVAIDLAGWTSSNAGHLFGPRIAPLQANWLGYFASSGLPSMDLWIGDQAVFPPVLEEWHTEKIVRLPRPFLAWQPIPELAEGQVDVPAGPPSNAPITFGCFNHLRKLGLPTLRLWAQILEALPQARLALKAFSTDDPGVVTLLRRRMQRAGLDPERVLWLPTCPRPTDHLRQYGLVDVALDPFPNGGCTTTCEALWMGVPVITLAGSHYVSRMATAVLSGAGLPQWICASEDHYLQRALQAAEQLPELRAGREALRQQLQASPLGDARGLGLALWQQLQAEFSGVQPPAGPATAADTPAPAPW